HHIVPYLADGCAIHVVDEAGALRRRAVRHVDPAKTRLMTDIEQRYPMEYQAPFGFPHVASSGEPDLHPRVKDEDLVGFAYDQRHLALLRALHMLVRKMRQGTLPSADYLTRRLSIVQDQSKRLDQLVSNLLDISRMTSGRLQLEPLEADLADLARHTLEQFQDQLDEAR